MQSTGHSIVCICHSREGPPGRCNCVLTAQCGVVMASRPSVDHQLRSISPSDVTAYAGTSTETIHAGVVAEGLSRYLSTTFATELWSPSALAKHAAISVDSFAENTSGGRSASVLLHGNTRSIAPIDGPKQPPPFLRSARTFRVSRDPQKEPSPRGPAVIRASTSAR